MIIDSLNKDTHYFTLDLHKGAILSEPLMFKQYDDKSRELAIELTVHDKPLNLIDARVDIWVDKQDGHTVTKAVDRANIDLENSIVVVPLTRQMLILPPSVECEIVVTYADKRVLSFPIFEVQIERSNVDVNDVVSTSEFQLFYDTLYQMERWMRDYLKNYAIISEAINNQLNLLRQKITDIGEDWDDLQEELTEQNNTNIENFKKENKEEFDRKYNEQLDFYNGLYTDREKEINRLLEKTKEMEKRVQEALEASENDRQLITALVTQCRDLKKEMETLHTDSVKKLEEITASLTKMETDFALEATARANSYTEEKNNRNKLFEDEQKTRQESFVNKEKERQADFTRKEELRQETFRSAEVRRNASEVERRANEEERVANETQRVEEFNEMKQQFNTFLQYRYVIE